MQVLSAGDDAVGLEQLEEDTDDIALQKARRSVRSMSAMSGASGMVYMEYKYIIPSFFVFFFFPQKFLGMYIISQIAKTISFYLFILQYFMLQWLFKSPVGYFAASSCQPLILSTNDIVVYLVAAPVGVSLGMARSKVSRRILQRDMSCLKGDLDKLFWKSSRYVLLMHSLPIVIATLCS